MQPTECKHHNFTYKGYGDVGDLSGFKGEGAFSSNWIPTPEEIDKMLAGGTVELRIFTEPIPPVALTVAEPEEGVGPAEGFEVVQIDGVPHKVPEAIAREMEALVEAAVKQMETFDPQPGTTIVITTPAGISRDFTEMVMNQAASQFADFKVSVMPDSLGLHTQDGLAELLGAGTAMAEAIRGLPADEVNEAAAAAADRWDELLGARGADES